MLKVYNSLTRKIEEFKPINPPNVGIYSCGPTVYDFMHIGNLRTFVLADLLSKVLTFDGCRVEMVQNITDIDDKIIKRAKEENLSIKDLTAKYIKYFLKDIRSLNISLTQDKMPIATNYIPKMIDYIQALIGKGLAYVGKDGSVYFDISKFENYGKLSQLEKRELKSGTRILSDNYTKEDVQDFALWKAVAEDEEAKFKSPWGWGRPGWHIECSVMSQEILGETFDIHLGGIDLMFPHHENEIAQAEGKTGKKFANYFIHGAHLFVDGRKMSKSLNNFYTLADIIKKGFDPLALRYLYLQTHYRQEMNFTWESLEGAQKALMRLRTDSQGESEGNQSEGEVEEKLVLFQQAVNDDLNMPQGLAVLWELLKLRPSLDRIKAIEKIDQVFSLELLKPSKKPSREIPDEVIALVQQRSSLRKGKRFHLADQLRNKIKKMGYEVTDEDGETIVTKIPKV